MSRYDAIAAAERKPETLFAACGVRRAMATRHQYRCENAGLSGIAVSLRKGKH